MSGPTEAAEPVFCSFCYSQGAATRNPSYHKSRRHLCNDPESTKGLCDCGKANDGHRYIATPTPDNSRRGGLIR